MMTTSSRIEPPVAAGLDPSHPLASCLAGCWLLNEGAGRVAHDASGYHHNGSFSGGPIWLAGPSGRALEFDGNDDWISMGDCLDLGTEDITVLALVQYSAAYQPNEWGGSRLGAIVGKGYLDGSGKGYGLLVDTTNQIVWQVRNQATEFSVGSDVALNDGQWHTVIGVCDRDSSTGLRLYVDGVPQGSAADPTSLNGVDLSGTRAFAVGSRQEAGGTWYWDFAGRVAAVYVWKRVLTEGEIHQLQRDPFALSARRRKAASIAISAQTIVGLAGTSAAAATLAAALTRERLVSLSGVTSSLSGSRSQLSVFTGPAGLAATQAERPWLQEALFQGATANAFKLGTALTQGWFWVRHNGCGAVYRGLSPTQIDLGRIVHVADAQAGEIVLPAYLSHPPGSTHYYLVRRFNNCGCQERTAAQVRVRIGSEGQLAPPAPNVVFGLKGEQIDGPRLRLSWFYGPLDQEIAPQEFRIYWDGATGQVDPEHPLATIPYRGRRFYQHETEPLSDGRYMFVVRPGSASRIESISSANIVCPVITLSPEAATILSAEAI